MKIVFKDIIKFLFQHNKNSLIDLSLNVYVFYQKTFKLHYIDFKISHWMYGYTYLFKMKFLEKYHIHLLDTDLRNTKTCTVHSFSLTVQMKYIFLLTLCWAQCLCPSQCLFWQLLVTTEKQKKKYGVPDTSFSLNLGCINILSSLEDQARSEKGPCVGFKGQGRPDMYLPSFPFTPVFYQIGSSPQNFTGLGFDRDRGSNTTGSLKTIVSVWLYWGLHVFLSKSSTARFENKTGHVTTVSYFISPFPHEWTISYFGFVICLFFCIYFGHIHIFWAILYHHS